MYRTDNRPPSLLHTQYDLLMTSYRKTLALSTFFGTTWGRGKIPGECRNILVDRSWVNLEIIHERSRHQTCNLANNLPSGNHDTNTKDSSSLEDERAFLHDCAIAWLTGDTYRYDTRILEVSS